ncbi:prepilin-type N-terminal cleavage/methylation domain-containing protein [Patescibacteria group bacterium]|nr:prepilin-type N-terminal cleavage/methylation domain-containing protein [Patescibacteria group bacterium]MBU1868549.1 prepilin-type N-terminal cleavage/methylation domain-containing protein [Patescibacteria group bacterium]
MNNRGLSLIEVLLVTALIAIVMTALVNLGVMSLRTSDQSRNRSIATESTKEAVEIARMERDGSASTFFNAINGDIGIGTGGYYELSGGSFSFVSFNVADVTPPNILDNFLVPGRQNFYRVVYFYLQDADTLDVWVKTYWRQHSGNYSVVRSGTVLTRWR